MENKEIVSIKKITTEIVIQKILWEIPFGILHSALTYPIQEYIPSIIFQITLLLALQFIIAFLTWKFSISASFAKYTIPQNDLSKLMKNVIIFAILECLLFALVYKFASVFVIIVNLTILPIVKKEISKQIA